MIRLVMLAALVACKPAAEVSCADATRQLDDVVYAGKTDAATLTSHTRICDEEGWAAKLRDCLVRATTLAAANRCAPDDDHTSPFLRGVLYPR
ncbi:MAG: hypothetical protein WKG01_41300 [Kofleriaceae bacterium]